ncbi:hypothetical protein [Novosphingobium sp. AP12]|uniref:hypothetical protein n=1 Tax=Novosphingobium sp. AP12 TaxID=1144305 RepID=UPI0012FBE232|nr:hypothetical protein [Novosphingobium sp. AP12]
MKCKTLIIAAISLLLGGSDMIRALLTRHGTNEADVRVALSIRDIPLDSLA